MGKFQEKLKRSVEIIVNDILKEKERERQQKGIADEDILCIKKDLTDEKNKLAELKDEIQKYVEKSETYFGNLVERLGDLEHSAEQINEQNLQYQGSINAGLKDLSKRLNSLEGSVAQINEQNLQYQGSINAGLKDLSKRLNSLEGSVAQINEQNLQYQGSINAGLKDLSKRLNSLEASVELINEQKIAEQMWFDKYKKLTSEVELLTENMSRQIAQLKVKYNELTRMDQIAILQDKKEREGQEEDQYADIDYFDFENHFRGAREVIKERLKIYLPHLKDKKSVVELGSGRGEFLELMRENNISAIGVDLYDEFVEYCKLKNLNAVHGDAVEYLESCDFVDAIFAGQLIEHLKLPQLLKMCNIAYDKLEKGGKLILETPNPTSLAIYTNSFYVDPSHEKPVHPVFIQYYLKKIGFKEAEIVYTEVSRLGKSIPDLQSDVIKNLDEYNKAIREVSELLYGSQDYAIIATK